MPAATSTTCDTVTRRAGSDDRSGVGVVFRNCCFKMGWNDTYVCSNYKLGHRL